MNVIISSNYEEIINKLRHQLDSIKINLIEMKYYNNFGRSFGQRLTSKFPSLYITP